MHRTAAAMALALGLCATSTSSCATVAGSVAGPVTGPLHLHENGLAAVPPWFRPFAFVAAVPFGFLAGFATGAAADWGWLVSGFDYGAPGHPPFAAVWNPMSPDWGADLPTPGAPLDAVPLVATVAPR